MLVNKFEYDGLKFLKTNPSQEIVESVLMEIYIGMHALHVIKYLPARNHTGKYSS